MRFSSAIVFALVLTGCAGQPHRNIEADSSLHQPDSAAASAHQPNAEASDESAIAGRDGEFGAWGFTFGTNQSTIEAHARLDGDEVNHHDEAITVVNRFDRKSQAWDTFILQFCNDHLYQISKPLIRVSPTSASAFIETLYSFVKERGTPIISLSEPLASGNLVEGIEYRWGSASNSTSLIFSTPIQPKGNVVAGMSVMRRNVAQCSGSVH